MDKNESYYKSLDKRTKEYKAWKAKYNEKPKGLGDTVEKITKATGIKKVVEKITGGDCGCDKRKEKLNKKFNYKIYECLTESEYNYIKNIAESNQNKVSHYEQHKLKRIYERVFNRKARMSCLSCNFVNVIWKPLLKIYETP